MQWFTRRNRMERQLDDEVRFHVERQIEQYVREGMSPEEARRRTLIEFGGTGQIREECREVWVWQPLEQLRQDLRYAVRLLRKNPGFTAVAALSLALGIGANTGIFSVVDALLLRNLPVRSPEQLMGFQTGDSATFSYPMFERFRDRLPALPGISAIALIDRYNLTVRGRGGDVPIGNVRVALVSGNYFSTFGVNAAMGRNLRPGDDHAGVERPAAVISDSAWKRWFEEQPDVVGRTLTVSGSIFTIVGVAPAGFTGDWMGQPADLWAPIAMQPLFETEFPSRVTSRSEWVRIVARLAPGANRSRMQAAAQVIHQQALREDAGPNPRPSQAQYIARQHMVLESEAKGFAPQRNALLQPLSILMVVVALVLLIACANIANLLLARSAARHKEIAMRLALGASRSRVVRQLLTESVLLSLIGGALGLLFARWGTSVLAKLVVSAPAQMTYNPSTSISLDLHPDLRAMLFTVGLCITAGIVFGLAPALRISRVSLSPDLREAGARGQRRGPFHFGGILVVAQVAVSLMLLIGAGLLVRTLHNLKSQDLGFERNHVTLVWTAPIKAGIRGPALASLFERAQERIASLPGVRSVSSSSNGVLGGFGNANAYRTHAEGLPQKAPSDEDFALWSAVTPGFFDAVGARLVGGRDFSARDNEKAARVAIIDEDLAHYLFHGQNAVGRHLGIKKDRGFPVEIVGVVKTIKYVQIRGKEREPGMMFLPYRQNMGELFQMCVAVRTSSDVPGLKPRIREELRNIESRLPVIGMVSTEEQLDDSLVLEHLIATLAAFFAGVGMVLACLGLYGVLAYATARRTNEIGIRLAMGATRGGVLGMVFKESLSLAAAGVAIGIPAALAVTRLVSARLYGVGANDPLTIAAAVLAMTMVATLAGFLPALRASKVDPVVALRYE
jgi:predicted permease